MNPELHTISIVGGGLAGSEVAFQLAQANHKVHLYEMRPEKMTPAHKTGDLAELVCSNSFGSMAHHSVSAQLKWEAGKMGSMILESADLCKVPAGQALGMDRKQFAKMVSHNVKTHKNIKIIPKEITDLNSLPRPLIIATGPLTSDSLANAVFQHFNEQFLYFFDAIAPIIEADSIDRSKTWVGDRYDKGTGDYINCPLNKEQYYNFINAVKEAQKTEIKSFEKDTPFFEGCMPIEEMIRRGDQTPRYGPLSPKGLKNPMDTQRAYAVVQLRKENREASSYNMVGFQTRMKYFEQKRVFRMIPGLSEACFLKLGSIHRNMYINPTRNLNKDFSSKNDDTLFFAGQITGVEGYFESTCTGLLAAYFLHGKLQNKNFSPPPRQTALGSLLYALNGEKKDHFQPTNINLGLFPPLEGKWKKREKREQVIERARKSFDQWFSENKTFNETREFIVT